MIRQPRSLSDLISRMRCGQKVRLQGARSAVWSFQMSDEQRSRRAFWPQPEGRASLWAQGGVATALIVARHNGALLRLALHPIRGSRIREIKSDRLLGRLLCTGTCAVGNQLAACRGGPTSLRRLQELCGTIPEEKTCPFQFDAVP